MTCGTARRGTRNGGWKSKPARPSGPAALALSDEQDESHVRQHPHGNGQPGPVTNELQRVFDDALHGRDPRYVEWLDVVKVPSKTV